ncbi:unnamed protein product, partial [marine sediment metagenome]
MKLLEFLKAVVPPGHLVSAHMEEGTYKYFQHTVADTHQQFAQQIVTHAQSKKDTYYALASFTQGFHRNAKDKRVVRVRENVAELKSLWLDIDFKDGYADSQAAILSLREFCKGAEMPPPSVLVHSGNGLHVYWPFTHSIPLNQWQLLADGLKSAAKQHGLRADLACTG